MSNYRNAELEAKNLSNESNNNNLFKDVMIHWSAPESNGAITTAKVWRISDNEISLYGPDDFRIDGVKNGSDENISFLAEWSPKSGYWRVKTNGRGDWLGYIWPEDVFDPYKDSKVAPFTVSWVRLDYGYMREVSNTCFLSKKDADAFADALIKSGYSDVEVKKNF